MVLNVYKNAQDIVETTIHVITRLVGVTEVVMLGGQNLLVIKVVVNV